MGHELSVHVFFFLNGNSRDCLEMSFFSSFFFSGGGCLELSFWSRGDMPADENIKWTLTCI